MTAKDIELATNVHYEKNKEFVKLLAWAVHNGAALVGIAINDPKKYPRLGEAFPHLFEQEEKQDWQLMKARMEAFAIRHNHKLSAEL